MLVNPIHDLLASPSKRIEMTALNDQESKWVIQI